MMRKLLLVLLCVTAWSTSVEAAECNATHFDFSSKYTLGKQDELNRTFIKMQEKITSLPDVAYNSSATTTFTITNVKPKFFYLDSKQKAVIRGNDTIFIEGGQLEVEYTFNWTRKEQMIKTGWGTAKGISF